MAPRAGKLRKFIMNAAQVNLNLRPKKEIDLVAPEQALSALVDGELDAALLEGLLAADPGRAEVFASWHAYHVIGDVLRGNRVVTPVHAPGDFLAGVRERLKSEPAPVDDGPRLLQSPPATLVRAPAANDAVFRWKLVAGVASLAAVMAVSWTVLNGAPAGTGGAAGPQLASAPAPTQQAASSVAVNATAAPSSAVVVNTGQGPLIRDARLEELLAEHRQNGGMSALQMPTGFIRNATYDAAGR
jgi:sigma-E factor negative regulatory protein RseA